MKLRHWMLALVLGLGLAGLAHAGTLNKRQEASQLLTGTIEVDAQGAVTGFTINERARLSESVGAYLDSVVPAWRFHPTLVDGKPVAARSDMTLRLLLRPAGEGNYALSVQGVTFGASQKPEGTYARAINLAPPDYPRQALVQNGGAAVYLIVKVGRDGRVEDAVAEQVNMLSYNNGASYLRKDFAVAAVKHAKKAWRFAPPTVGDAADDPYWTVRVPVLFQVILDEPRNGWQVYEPGPRQKASWDVPPDPVGFSPDALPSFGAHQVGGGDGLRLLDLARSP